MRRGGEGHAALGGRQTGRGGGRPWKLAAKTVAATATAEGTIANADSDSDSIGDLSPTRYEFPNRRFYYECTAVLVLVTGACVTAACIRRHL